MPELDRIKRNVARMSSMGAPVSEIDGYISSEGVTVEDIKNHKGGSPMGSQVVSPNYPMVQNNKTGKVDFQNATDKIDYTLQARKKNRVLTMGENTKVAGAEDVLGFINELKGMYGKKGEGVNWSAEATSEARRIPIIGNALYGLAGVMGTEKNPITREKNQLARQDFSDLTENLNNRLLYLRSGAQINDKEFQRLTRLMPSMYRKNKLDVKQLERFESEFQNIKSRIEKGVTWDKKSKSFVTPKGEAYNPDEEPIVDVQEEIDINKLFSDSDEE